MVRVALVLIVMILAANRAAAGGITSYFESSAQQKPRSNAGLSVNGDRLRLDAGVALRAPDRHTEVTPRLRSVLAITDRVGWETRVDLPEWNTRADLSQATFDTRLHYQSPAPFLDELEGRIWRSPDGQSKQILKFGFYQNLRESGVAAPLTISSKAVFETATGPASLALDSGAGALRPENRRVGIETVIAGLTSSFWAGESALRLTVERIRGTHPQSAQSVAYDHAWRVTDATRLGLNLSLRRAYAPIELFEPTVGLTWRAEF
jgi:hypothetical protein